MSAGFNFDLLITRFGVYPGSTAATEPVALVLRSGLVNETFGSGFDCVRLDMHFKHEGRAPRPFAAADIARYHQYLDTFPKVTARRKASRIEIQSAMALSPKSFADGCAPSVPGFEQLSAEVVLALKAARPKLVKIRDFEFAALLAKVESTLASIPPGQKAFLAMIAKLRATEDARAEAILAADPWAALSIEWTDYHSAARALLDDPFFWDVADDHAPVGNDTGADILESYRSWRRRRKASGPEALAYVEKILNDWGMPESGDEDARLVRDEAFIALAFAQAMLDGAVAEAVSTRALAAIERQLPCHKVWPQPRTRRATLEKMRAKLVALQ